MSRLALTPTNVPSLASAPTFPSLRNGDMYFNSTSQGLFVYYNGTWLSVSSGSLPTELDAGVFDSVAPYDGGNSTTTATQTFDGGTP